MADKARQLSLKHGLRDEAQLIELEEMRLMKLLQEEERRYHDQIKSGRNYNSRQMPGGSMDMSSLKKKGQQSIDKKSKLNESLQANT